MGPKGGSERAFSAETILGPVWLIFLDETEGAGVTQLPATGQSPVGRLRKRANTKGSAAIPAATASRGNVIPAIWAVAAFGSG